MEMPVAWSSALRLNTNCEDVHGMGIEERALPSSNSWVCLTESGREDLILFLLMRTTLPLSTNPVAEPWIAQKTDRIASQFSLRVRGCEGQNPFDRDEEVRRPVLELVTELVEGLLHRPAPDDALGRGWV